MRSWYGPEGERGRLPISAKGGPFLGLSMGSRIWKNEKGLSLIGLIVAILVLGTIGIILSRLMSAHQESIPLVLDTTRAFYAAQGGVEYAGKYLKTSGGNDWTLVAPIPNQPKNMGMGTFTVTFTPLDADHLTAVVIGTSGAAQRQITVRFEKTSGSAAIRSRGTVTLGNNAVLDCDPLDPSNPLCTPANLMSCPCIRQQVPPTDMPSFTLPSPTPPASSGRLHHHPGPDHSRRNLLLPLGNNRSEQCDGHSFRYGNPLHYFLCLEKQRPPQP